MVYVNEIECQNLLGRELRKESKVHKSGHARIVYYICNIRVPTSCLCSPGGHRTLPSLKKYECATEEYMALLKISVLPVLCKPKFMVGIMLCYAAGLPGHHGDNWILELQVSGSNT